MDYNILIAGAAGQGMDTVVANLNKVLQRSGYHLWTNADYKSRVRGGHNFFQIRFSEDEITSHKDELDMIFALNKESIDYHIDRLKKEKSIAIIDESIEGYEDDNRVKKYPMNEKSKQIGNPKLLSSIGLGIIMKFFGLNLDIAKDIIAEKFKDEILEMNKKALDYGYSLEDSIYKLEKIDWDNILINGNQAVALGAVAAGCKFYCGYPMTPSSGVLDYMFRASEKLDIAVEQVEDEVAALNMALGASFTGVRAMTGSSGGGIALMQEAISLQGVTETPIVLINVMRPAPATGLPTYTEQSDLRFMMHAGHGEFPRYITAPRNAQDAFDKTVKSFDIAEKYQLISMILSDQYLADVDTTLDPFNLDEITINRYLANPDDYKKGEYKRYEITENGISPRLIPAHANGNFVMADSDEHNELGRIDESADNRVKMVDKRAKKFELLKEDVEEPWEYGAEDFDILAVCFGSIHGNLKEAIDILNDEGMKIKGLSFGDIYPLPTGKLSKYQKKAHKFVVVEQNHDEQFESLIRQQLLIKPDKSIRKYDGRQMSRDFLVEKLKEI
ncbi:MAG: 2-oxoacid:acceptor oxidoreductase subunit alpha [Tissierellia bacterium]|nr:2-oxoacid:acceptor oxidoreductase subunit alpha [Tissierellia bacterium]